MELHGGVECWVKENLDQALNKAATLKADGEKVFFDFASAVYKPTYHIHIKNICKTLQYCMVIKI